MNKIKSMIAVAEAKALITKNIVPLPAVMLLLPAAAGHVLAQDIVATIDIPSFEQSSMDGYAVRFEDTGMLLKVTGEMAAGSTGTFQLQAGEAARIFTGAPLPHGADTVVMQERVTADGITISISDALLQQGSHVRHKGAEIKAGALAMPKGCYLSPAAIGFLAGIGVTTVAVYPMPAVSIIITGQELQQPGYELLAGQVYESNSYSLTAALQQAGVTQINLLYAADDLASVTAAVTQALLSAHLVIITGGVSVGKYDFVVAATKACGVAQLFHKVKQRPGKPLYAGMKQQVPVFGLPGNPSSVLSCFYNYVLPAIELMAGKISGSKKVQGTLTKDYAKAAGLTHFLKGAYQNGFATPLSAQESFQLSSFAFADCLICLEETHGNYTAGETVEVYLLPHSMHT